MAFSFAIRKTHFGHTFSRTCTLEAIISLPVDTFYSTPKKTYILILRKKQKPDDTPQSQPVFTYLVSNTGETLDAKRFVIAENDLPTMASLFKSFQPALFTIFCEPSATVCVECRRYKGCSRQRGR